MPFMVMHDPMTNGKAEASPLSFGFGGKEGVKDMCDGFRGYSYASIRKGDCGEAIPVQGGNLKLSTVWHGVNGVVHDVQDDLLEFVEVAVNPQRSLCKLCSNGKAIEGGLI